MRSFLFSHTFRLINPHKSAAISPEIAFNWKISWRESYDPWAQYVSLCTEDKPSLVPFRNIL